MTPEEVGRIWEACEQAFNDRNYRLVTALGKAHEAARKQIPRKPRQSEGKYYIAYFCPECAEAIPINGAYCMTCGQALDWKELND